MGSRACSAEDRPCSSRAPGPVPLGTLRGGDAGVFARAGSGTFLGSEVTFVAGRGVPNLDGTGARSTPFGSVEGGWDLGVDRGAGPSRIIGVAGLVADAAGGLLSALCDRSVGIVLGRALCG
jgi:hypothetical protein